MLRLSMAVGNWPLCLGLAVIAINVSPGAQIVEPRVQIETGDATLMHRTPVIYPEVLMQRGVEGTVVVEVTLDDAGSVIDARVLSGPAELRKPALESVLDWHFTRDGVTTTRQVSVAFRLLPVEDKPGESAIVTTTPNPPSAEQESSIVMPDRILGRITVLGLSDPLRDELLLRLPVHVGDKIFDDSMRRLGMELRKFDEHLRTYVIPLEDGHMAIEIKVPE